MNSMPPMQRTRILHHDGASPPGTSPHGTCPRVTLSVPTLGRARLAVLGAVLALALAMALPARAAETILHLAESATIMVPPDELASTMRAEATAGSPAEAQSRVNALATTATAAATAVPGVKFSTGGYQVWRIGPNPQERTEKWQASQTFHLTSGDSAALLGLVATLQQKGLAVSAMQWRLSRATEKQTRQEATRQAVQALRGRADETAGMLDLRFDHFRAIRLDGSDPESLPRPMQMAMARSADAAPPVAVAEDLPVTATARAEAVLTPR